MRIVCGSPSLCFVFIRSATVQDSHDDAADESLSDCSLRSGFLSDSSAAVDDDQEEGEGGKDGDGSSPEPRESTRRQLALTFCMQLARALTQHWQQGLVDSDRTPPAPPQSLVPALQLAVTVVHTLQINAAHLRWFATTKQPQQSDSQTIRRVEEVE